MGGTDRLPKRCISNKFAKNITTKVELVVVPVHNRVLKPGLLESYNNSLDQNITMFCSIACVSEYANLLEDIRFVT